MASHPGARPLDRHRETTKLADGLSDARKAGRQGQDRTPSYASGTPRASDYSRTPQSRRPAPPQTSSVSPADDKATIASLTAQLRQLSAERASLVTAVATAQKTASDAEERAQSAVTAENEVVRLQNLSEEQRETIEQLQCAKEELNHKLEEVSANLIQRDEALAAKESRCAELDHQCAETHEKLAEAQEALRQLQSENALLLTEREERITQLSQEVERLQAQLMEPNSEGVTPVNNSSLEAEVTDLRLRLERSEALRRQLHNDLVDTRGRIRCYCRVRPSKESASFDFPQGEYGSVVELITSRQGPFGGEEHKAFGFDRVFTPHALQEDVYSEISPLITSAADGFNVSIFAYGQTGSGKTHTMVGSTQLLTCGLTSPSRRRRVPTERALVSEESGIIPRAVIQLLEAIRSSDLKAELRCSVFEIYNERCYDLLAAPLDVQEEEQPYLESRWEAPVRPQPQIRVTEPSPGVIVLDQIKELSATTAQEALDVFQCAVDRRQIASTQINSRSSRSHTVFRLTLVSEQQTPAGVVRRSSVINFVDLAGSERLARAHGDLSQDAAEEVRRAYETRLSEMRAINSSLSSLSAVMQQLASGDGHVSFRDSLLTRVLQSSLSGSGKCCLIVCVGGDSEDVARESINTMQFGQTVRSIKRKNGAPRRNVHVHQVAEPNPSK